MNQSELELVDEQLTAYLDGELTLQEATALEQRLVVDEKLRIRLADLRKAYDLLDEIPETPHNQRFTKSTMELVIKDLSNTELTASSGPIRSANRNDWLAWPRVLFLFCGLAAAGSLSAFSISSLNHRSELSRLGLFAAIRGLHDANDLETAIKLSQETEVLAELKVRFGEEVVPPPPSSISERMEWVESLTPNQTSRLKSGREMFGKMDRAERARWTSMESKLEARSDSKQVQEAIYIIGMVMDSKTRAREELEVMNQEQRIAYLRNELSFRAAMHYAQHMTPADAKALSDWDINTLNPALIQDNPSPSSRFNETRVLLALLLMRPQEHSFERQDELVDELIPTLSKTAASIIAGISKKEDQLRVLFYWLFRDRIPREQLLLEAYENLEKNARNGNENKEKLDLGDPDDFSKNLMNMRNGMGPSRRP